MPATGVAQRVAQALDDEKGPRIAFADGTQSIYLADLFFTLREQAAVR